MEPVTWHPLGQLSVDSTLEWTPTPAGPRYRIDAGPRHLYDIDFGRAIHIRHERGSVGPIVAVPVITPLLRQKTWWYVALSHLATLVRIGFGTIEVSGSVRLDLRGLAGSPARWDTFPEDPRAQGPNAVARPFPIDPQGPRPG